MKNKPKLELVEVSRRTHRSSGAEEGRPSSENGEARPRRRQDGSGEHRRRMQESRGEEVRRQSSRRYKDYGSVSLGQLPSRAADEVAPETAAHPASDIPAVPSAGSERTEDRYAFVLKRKFRKRNRLVPFLVFGGLAVLLVGLLLAVLLRSGGQSEKPLPRPEEDSMSQEDISENEDEMIETN